MYVNEVKTSKLWQTLASKKKEYEPCYQGNDKTGRRLLNDAGPRDIKSEMKNKMKVQES